jgi:hypothetical protein
MWYVYKREFALHILKKLHCTELRCCNPNTRTHPLRFSTAIVRPFYEMDSSGRGETSKRQTTPSHLKRGLLRSTSASLLQLLMKDNVKAFSPRENEIFMSHRISSSKTEKVRFLGNSGPLHRQIYLLAWYILNFLNSKTSHRIVNSAEVGPFNFLFMTLSVSISHAYKVQNKSKQICHRVYITFPCHIYRHNISIKFGPVSIFHLCMRLMNSLYKMLKTNTQLRNRVGVLHPPKIQNGFRCCFILGINSTAARWILWWPISVHLTTVLNQIQ